MSKKTMSIKHYGISAPSSLFEKLKFDADRLTVEPHPYDVFNFMLTAASLREWVIKYYDGDPLVESISNAFKKNDYSFLVVDSEEWISNKDCLPNKHCDVRRHIFNSMSICWYTANASKHYFWNDNPVKKISDKPIVEGWYQYFTSSREPDLHFDYGGETYSLSQIKCILVQFYEGALNQLNKLEGNV